MLLLLGLIGVAVAQTPAPTLDACHDNEFRATGYFTGQNIEMNYEGSEIKQGTVAGQPATILHLEYFVPKRYVEQYEANSFALTFNRARGSGSLTVPTADDQGNAYNDWEGKVRMYVDQVDGSDQSACFSNRYDNYTYCENMVEGLWSTDEVNAENPCIRNVKADIPWANVMGTAFGINTDTDVQDDGNYIEIFLTATVETWTHFVEGVTSKNNGLVAADYLGVMTGGESLLNTDIANSDTLRTGRYGNDAGWQGWPADPMSGEFGDIVIDDERYTLYQIPFILRFPKTVVVETSFMAAQKITMLTGVVAQDVIQINLNPETDAPFAYVEAVLTTQVQYPYGIRSPRNTVAPTTVVVGSTTAGTGTHAASVEFVEFDDPGGCMEDDQFFADEGTCTQSFKFRMTPTTATPCTVAGDYTFEMWAECVGEDEPDVMGCAIDDLVGLTGNLAEQRRSNAYFTETITINHQPFCPELMDEIRVVGDFRVYKDEAFSYLIDNDPADTEPGKNVFTNDQLFFEAEYRTASSKSGETINDNGYLTGEYGDDSIIDYVRATKIFMEVTLGKQRDGSATTAHGGWQSDNWESNMDFRPLGLTRIPGVDFTEDVTVTVNSGDSAEYEILLCEVPEVLAEYIRDLREKPNDDCFTNKKNIAVDFLDFTKVERSLAGSSNTIDENEVAFNMRMDERILPVKPGSDDSFIKVTIESEIYYKGNRHPTRRLLQTDAPDRPDRRQQHAMSVGYPVQHRQPIDVCTVANDQESGMVKLQFQYAEEANMPNAGDMASFTSDLSMQIDAYHHLRGAVSVERVEKCNDECFVLYARGSSNRAARRRTEVEGSHVNVYLSFQSVSANRAGQIMNVFQANVANSRSDMQRQVALFREATVASMTIDGCNGVEFGHVDAAGPSHDRGELADFDMYLEEESSASRSSATLTVVFCLLFIGW